MLQGQYTLQSHATMESPLVLRYRYDSRTTECCKQTLTLFIFRQICFYTAEQKTSTNARVTCDMIGNKFCSKHIRPAFQVTSSEELTNGNFKCALKPSRVARVIDDFVPSLEFDRLGEGIEA